MTATPGALLHIKPLLTFAPDGQLTSVAKVRGRPQVMDKLVELFGKEHPGYTRQDFYELELATSGMLRSFMARKCDRSFTMEQKLRRFLSCGMTIYGVDQEKQQEVIDQVLKMDLKSVADQLLAQAMAQSQEEFREAERKGKALEAARRG